MDDYGHYSKPKLQSFARSFTWDCPECKKYIVCYTQKALDIWRAEHLSEHKSERQEENAHIDSVQKFRQKNPNKLDVTLIDIGFLKTRGIKMDDDIVLDFSITAIPTQFEGLSLREWTRILERALWRNLGSGN